MSMVLPELERQLHEAAARRARRRHTTRLVAPALAAAAAVAVAFVVALGAASDPDVEREVPSGRGSLAAPAGLGSAYSAFSGPGTPVGDPSAAALPITIVGGAAATPTPTSARREPERPLKERRAPEPVAQHPQSRPAATPTATPTPTPPERTATPVLTPPPVPTPVTPAPLPTPVPTPVAPPPIPTPVIPTPTPASSGATPTPVPFELVRAVAERGTPALDLRRPVLSWPLYERDGLRIAAWIGYAPGNGAQTVCFPHWEGGRPTGGDCRPTAAIVDAGASPTMVRAGHDDGGYFVTLLVPDRVTGIVVEDEHGVPQEVPIDGNIAVLRSSAAPCRVTWSAPGGGSELRLPMPGGCD